MQNSIREYEHWRSEARKRSDRETIQELIEIQNDDNEIEERFYKELEFGTAGLRGIIGVGTNRMNRYVIRRATAGLALYLKRSKNMIGNGGVAIAYDSRNYSEKFAIEAACTLASYGIRSYLYIQLHSVPQLSFAVRQINCSAGIVITASHNPPEYNGFKIYSSNGAQVDPDQASSILECIHEIDYFDVAPVDFRAARRSGDIVVIGKDLDEIYYNNIMGLMLRPQLVREFGGNMPIVYTPLHGSGYEPINDIRHRMGLSDFYIVREQMHPNGDFPTVRVPNPEDPAAYELAKELANQVDADLILATDPDADRLGVAVRLPSGFKVLTGNQIGCILINYLLKTKQELGELPDNGLVVKSLVSTPLADAICNKFGVEIVEVLTGFRFIGEQMDIAELRDKKFLFGFEESYGFLAGNFVRDKDAICAATLITEAAIYYSTQGKNLYDVLNDIYQEYGYYVEQTKSYSLSGKIGIEKIANAMNELRSNPPTAFGELKVLTYEDFEVGTCKDLTTGEEKTVENKLPSANLLRFSLPDEAWVVVRPSGTEPKLKIYTGVKADSMQNADAALEKLMNDVNGIVEELLK